MHFLTALADENSDAHVSHFSSSGERPQTKAVPRLCCSLLPNHCSNAVAALEGGWLPWGWVSFAGAVESPLLPGKLIRLKTCSAELQAAVTNFIGLLTKSVLDAALLVLFVVLKCSAHAQPTVAFGGGCKGQVLWTSRAQKVT